MRNLNRKSTVVVSAAVVTALTAAAAGLLTSPAVAKPAPQQKKNLPKVQVIIPRDVLLFPADVTSGSEESSATSAAPQLTPTQKMIQDEVTEAFRSYFSQSGLGVLTYSKRLPSVQRAVAEGTIKAEQAAAGPGDDPRSALAFASAVGAAEYVTLDITNYKYDPATRTATFNVSIERNSAEDNGAPLATVAKPAQGTAPASVSAVRQEQSAVSYAAQAVAEQAFQDLYPQIAELKAVQQMKANRSSKKK